MNGPRRKIAAILLAAPVGDEFDGNAARGESCFARASAGNRCPPVPPAATRIGRRSLMPSCRSRIGEDHEPGRFRVTAIRKPMPAPAKKRGAAIGNEGQRHALGRHQMQIDRHVDRALHAEQHDEPGRGEAAERILVARRHRQAAQHDEGEDGDDEKAGDDAEFLRRHGEDEIRMRVGQDALERPFARPLAEPAAGIGSSRAPYPLETCRLCRRRTAGSMNFRIRARTCGTNL